MVDKTIKKQTFLSLDHPCKADIWGESPPQIFLLVFLDFQCKTAPILPVWQIFHLKPRIRYQ